MGGISPRSEISKPACYTRQMAEAPRTARHTITCPTCGNERLSVFVREGAAVRCRACGGTFRIEARHIQRSSARGGEGDDKALASAEGDASGRPGLAKPQAGDPHHDTDHIGLSGLSEIMGRSSPKAAEEVGGEAGGQDQGGRRAQAGAKLDAAGTGRGNRRASPERPHAGRAAATDVTSTGPDDTAPRSFRTAKWFLLLSALVAIAMLAAATLILNQYVG